MKKYDVDYFIKKFEAIPEEKWYQGTYFNEDKTAFCALGHCGQKDYKHTKQSIALINIFKKADKALNVYNVNDGNYNWYSDVYIEGFRDFNIYLGDTPKERILNALYNIKGAGLWDQLEKT